MAYNKETGMYEGYIYIIQNDIDPDQVYIGQTISTPTNRWRGHCDQVKKHTYTDKLHNKMAKYGIEHFAMDVLEKHDLKTKELLINRLDEREISLIKLFDSYYNGLNCTKGGRGAKEHQMRAVQRFDLDGNYIAEYESVDALKIEYDSVCSIYDCCNHGNSKYAYGFLWKYKDDSSALPILTDEEKAEATLRYKMILPIDEYDYKGVFLKTYKNADEVILNNPGIKKKQLAFCCTGKRVYVGTNIYRFHGDAFNLYRTYRENPKLVEQYTLDGKFIRVFESARKACIAVGIKGSQVSDCCLGKRKTAGGYMWKYVEDNSCLPDLRYNGHCKKVYQYDLNTLELEKIFLSITDAANYNNLSSATISNIAYGNKKDIYHNKIWSFYELSENEIISKTVSKNSKPIIQADLFYNYINSYNSATEAAKKLFPDKPHASVTIGAVCRHIKKSAYGYRWFFENDMEYIGKINNKGGDNVA